MIAATASLTAGAVLTLIALDKLIRYSPGGNPQAGRVGFTLLAVALLLVGVPVAAMIAALVIGGVRRHNAWMRTLTPRERVLVHFAEGAAMEAGHLAMRDRNRREDARLSDSVIGIERSSGDERQT
jgi:hypothetical protein